MHRMSEIFIQLYFKLLYNLYYFYNSLESRYKNMIQRKKNVVAYYNFYKTLHNQIGSKNYLFNL